MYYCMWTCILKQALVMSSDGWLDWLGGWREDPLQIRSCRLTPALLRAVFTVVNAFMYWSLLILTSRLRLRGTGFEEPVRSTCAIEDELASSISYYVSTP